MLYSRHAANTFSLRLLTCFGKHHHDDGECSAVGAQCPGHGWSNSCLAWLARQLNKSTNSLETSIQATVNDTTKTLYTSSKESRIPRNSNGTTMTYMINAPVHIVHVAMYLNMCSQGGVNDVTCIYTCVVC